MNTFTLKIEIDENDITAYMDQNNLTRDDALGNITNVLYMGLSCIDGMMLRATEIENIDSYVECFDGVK